MAAPMGSSRINSASPLTPSSRSRSRDSPAKAISTTAMPARSSGPPWSSAIHAAAVSASSAPPAPAHTGGRYFFHC